MVLKLSRRGSMMQFNISRYDTYLILELKPNLSSITSLIS